ncbi:MAG: beta-lactamase family protein [Gammaproteobacteria bacterium]|nr:beta-lactamase family protein [Gammaproteobacteria bacterium]
MMSAVLPDGDSVQCVAQTADQSCEISANSVFWLASLTKAITSVAAMQLVESGQLTLDEPVARLLPVLASPKILHGYDENGKARLSDAETPITLRHLLTHTSGLAYPFSNSLIGRYAEEEGLPATISGDPRAYLLPLLSEPGTQWHYGVSTDWVGQLIEAATGESLETVFKTRIFAPLGMASSSFFLSEEQKSRLMPVYKRLPDKSFKQIPFQVPQNPEMYAAGAGLYSTPGDYLRFLNMLLHKGQLDGQRILSEGSVQAMSSKLLEGPKVGCIDSCNAALTNDYDPFPGVDKAWGLGFSINKTITPQGRKPGSFGWAGLSNIYYWVDPASRITGLFMTQILPFADQGALASSGECERILYDSI